MPDPTPVPTPQFRRTLFAAGKLGPHAAALAARALVRAFDQLGHTRTPAGPRLGVVRGGAR